MMETETDEQRIQDHYAYEMKCAAHACRIVFPKASNEKHRRYLRYLFDYLVNVKKCWGCGSLQTKNAKQLDNYRSILATERTDLRNYVLVICEVFRGCERRLKLPELDMCAWMDKGSKIPQRVWRDSSDRHAVEYMQRDLRFLLNGVLSKNPPLDQDSINGLLGWLRASKGIYPETHCLKNIVRTIEYFAAENKLNRVTLNGIGAISKTLARNQDPVSIDLLNRLSKILGKSRQILVKAGEPWSDAAISDLNELKSEAHSAWGVLIEHCQSAPGGQPTKKWLANASKLIDVIGRPSFKKTVLRWFSLVSKPRPVVEEGRNRNYGLVIVPTNIDILRGLVWCCSIIDDAEIVRALGALGVTAYRKINVVVNGVQIGARAPRIGNACVWALGTMPGLDAVGQLAYMRARVKGNSPQTAIEKALNAAAERTGMSREDLDELSVSSNGLTEVGRRDEKFGDVTAELRIIDSDVELTWRRADGNVIASVPAAVKTEYAIELLELKMAKADIGKVLSAQRERLDSLFLQRRTWPIAIWRERYIDHPLIGTLARRLIWRFKREKSASAGIFQDGKIVDLRGKELRVEDTTVELWHPLDESVDSVQAWRRWLEEHQVRQPFKQAHREIYLLTDAERQTRAYSNRFAAHIIRQHQFHALCGVRRWKNNLRLVVAAKPPPPQRILPEWNLRAEFWVEGVGHNLGRDTNDVSAFNHLSTDQVRFYSLDSQNSDEPLALDRIPPIVFSEVMRDVDLFVGVCSVSNDPAWVNGAREATERTYWRDHSFGGLSETAKTRKQVLESLIPRLKVAPRCSFDEKFLIVKGEIRTYKIHLGSGNILMAPNDQYLCIVAKQSADVAADGKVFLPFEGDNTLAIILSKAFMLANDTKIKDPSIVSQIKR